MKIGLWPLLTCLLAWFGVRLAIAYARRRGLFDQPGQRRSHQVPTPRGGGIGVVAALAVGLAGLWLANPTDVAGVSMAALLVALLAVALIGWWDDHRPLGIVPRLIVQWAAAGLFVLAWLDHAAWGWLPVWMLLGVWSINLHNFMDGIDGLLAQQGVFVGAGIAWLAWGAGSPTLAGMAACLAAACLGFWYYNRAPARIFVGDVGSGSIGFMVFALTAMLWRVRHELLWPALVLSSAFAMDAGLTLALRMLRGRRWYAAHREHLYQWLVRRGFTHAGSSGLYLTWNLCVALPLAIIAALHPPVAWAVCLLTYLLAALGWWQARRMLYRRKSHVPA